jgi:hypothetical protein
LEVHRKVSKRIDKLTRRFQRGFAGLAVIAFSVALFDLFTEGADFSVGPIRLSTREPFRPLLIGVLSGTIAIWLSDRVFVWATKWDWVRRWSAPLAVAVAIVTVALGIRFGDFAAGGADAYGYVSQAYLWAAGNLVMSEPLGALIPALGESVAPLGYRLAQTPGDIVPVYSPGLPLLMAVGLKIAGAPALSLVIPIMGGVAVWFTYILGARVAGSRTGLAAAGLVGCSPIFLAQLIQPMSDVPVTAWWLAALALASSEKNWKVLLAGGASSLALLTRPNLAPLALVVGLLVIRSAPRVPRIFLFGVGLIPGCLAIALINQTLFGSPLTSGYGSLDTIFEWNRLGANLRRYPLWLLQVQSVFVYLALAAPLRRFRSPDARATDSGVRDVTVAWLLLAFCGVLALSYLFYVPFEDWRFLRFLLPAVPLLLILTSAVANSVIATVPISRRAAIAFAFFGLLGCWYLKKAADFGLLAPPGGQNRYVMVGEHVARELPKNAVLITVLHSGSGRMYGHRSTVRWDILPDRNLDRAVNVLKASGYAPYLVLEDWEEPLFRERFEKTNAFGRLDALPSPEFYRDHVRIWALSDISQLAVPNPVESEPGTKGNVVVWPSR